MPLRVHGRYSRAEVLAAFAIHDGRGAPRSHREGVLWHQSTTTVASPTGQRTIHHQVRGSRVLLFVREQRKQDGRPGSPTEPLVCLGFASYEGHEGERIWFVPEWRSAGGCSARSRRRGCTAVVFHTNCCLA